MTGKRLLLLFFLIALSLSGEKTGNASKKTDLLRNNRLEIRAYDGAPPVIPHEISELGRDNCLSCHKEGSGLKKEKRSPITPHPQWTNCRQCHVAKQTDKEFVPSTYKKREKNTLIETNNPAGPPYIPHHLQNRSNCAVCHLSVTAKKEIVPHHGNRTNCLQCHVQLQRRSSPFR